MSDLDLNELSPTLRAMAAILSDGGMHESAELHKCCGPSSPRVVRVHMTRLRGFLPRGEAIICEFKGKKFYYRWVRLLSSPNDGKR